jgi:hypothetical protein
MEELSKLINDSIPEKKVALVITSPGFMSSSVNAGRVRLALVDPSEREKSQKEVVDDLNKWAKKYPQAKVNVSEQPTISVNRRGGLPIQYIIQAPNFEKLRDQLAILGAELLVKILPDSLVVKPINSSRFFYVANTSISKSFSEPILSFIFLVVCLASSSFNSSSSPSGKIL